MSRFVMIELPSLYSDKMLFFGAFKLLVTYLPNLCLVTFSVITLTLKRPYVPKKVQISRIFISPTVYSIRSGFSVSGRKAEGCFD